MMDSRRMWERSRRSSSQWSVMMVPVLSQSPVLAVWLCTLTLSVAAADDLVTASPKLSLVNPAVKDQDDVCIWRDADHPERSTLIASDKSANALFVYDLTGQLLQQIEIPKPGNIDLRHGVVVDGKSIDIVAVNQRVSGFRICTFAVDAQTRTLRRLDDGSLLTGPNYGGCLYHNNRTGRLYFLTTSDKGTVEQHELMGNGAGGIQSQKVRDWPIGKCESAVADDAASEFFISEEARGVWKVAAEPGAETQGELIIKVGEHGMRGDVEGLALSDDITLGKILVVSDQGRSRFMVYQRNKPYAFLGEFTIEGARDTDGIDLISLSMGPGFPQGLFACHTDQAPRPVLVTSWNRILEGLIGRRNQKGNSN